MVTVDTLRSDSSKSTGGLSDCLKRFCAVKKTLKNELNESDQ